MAAQFVLEAASSLQGTERVREDSQVRLHPEVRRHPGISPSYPATAQQAGKLEQILQGDFLRQQSRVFARRKSRAGDCRRVPKTHQERHRLLELPVPLAANRRGGKLRPEAGAN